MYKSVSTPPWRRDLQTDLLPHLGHVFWGFSFPRDIQETSVCLRTEAVLRFFRELSSRFTDAATHAASIAFRFCVSSTYVGPRTLRAVRASRH